MKKKTLKVYAIQKGTVIDHLPAGSSLKIAELLNLQKSDKTVIVGINFESQKYKKKDIVKIEGKELTSAETNQIALIAPYATVNIIRGYKIIKKAKIKIPRVLKDILECPNPKCITNQEKVPTSFSLSDSHSIRIKCEYCEKIFTKEEISFKNNHGS